MRPATTLAAFAGGLALVFTAAAGVGNAVGPVGTVSEPAPGDTAPHDGTSDTGGVTDMDGATHTD